jgi:histidinol-phosphate aminotransferase
MVFIANPNNPTGTWVPKKELTEFLDRIREDVLVVLDEAYFEYVEEAEYPDGISLCKRYPNLVVTRTFSKAYGLASLRIGYAVSHPDIADLMNRVRQPFNVNSMSMVAALAALDDQTHVRQSVELNKKGLSYLESECRRLGLGYIPSVANFLTINFGRDAMPIYDSLLLEGVIVRPVGIYELPNHLRVTVGTEEENRRFVEALEKII